MDIKSRIDADTKTALLAGEKQKVTTLRGLKSAILYVEVAQDAREKGLEEATIIDVLAKEAKKRQESADMYKQAGDAERTEKELVEKAIIEEYLPAQLSDEELQKIIAKATSETAATGPQAMGQVIGAVKQQTAGQADGARIAQFVKEQLQ
jgi:uncharacterized protein YqeY